MPDSPFGIGYGLGTATSGLMGSYMQGQQYGLQREQQMAQMDMAKRHAALQERQGEAQIGHLERQNAAIDEDTRQKVLNFAKRRVGDALTMGDWSSAAEAGAALGFHVDPSEMAYVTNDGQKAANFDQAHGVAFVHDGQTMFLPKSYINELRNGDKYAVQGLRNEGTMYSADRRVEGGEYRADKQLEGQQYRADKQLEGVKYSADKRLQGVFQVVNTGAKPAKVQEAESLTQQFVEEGMSPIDARRKARDLAWPKSGVGAPDALKTRLNATKAMLAAITDKVTGKALKGYESDREKLLNDLATIGEDMVNTGPGSGGSGMGGGKPAPSQADLEYTAKKHGITVEEVKRRLGVK